MSKLKTYRDKRKFDRTTEPAGNDSSEALATNERIFVIQKHQASHLHYDLRLELDGVLKSWAVPKGPSIKPGEKRLAVEVEDHPLEYATFEGTIPQGEYGGGTVMLWDFGVWTPMHNNGRVDDERLDFQLHGQKLQGAWSLIRTTKRSSKKAKPHWLLIKRRDSGTERSSIDDLSVVSGRTMHEIAEGAEAKTEFKLADNSLEKVSQIPRAKSSSMPSNLTPALATLEAEVPKGDGWIHEIKLDGYRLLARVINKEVKLLTRNGHDWTSKLPALRQILKELPCDEALLDGEIVAYEAAGVTNFGSLQQAFSNKSTATLIYQVFDLPYLNGYDLSQTPLVERKMVLKALLQDMRHADSKLKYTDHLAGQGEAFFQHACELGLEGIISKQARSPYRRGRTRNWLKVKCSGREDFVICGYTAPKGARTGFGALLLGAWHGDTLLYTGKVGTGFNQQTLNKLGARLKSLAVEKSPLHTSPGFTDVTWVAPKLVAAVEFSSWTTEGRLRHPVFLGLREDIVAADVQVPAEYFANQPSLQSLQQGPSPPAAKPALRRNVALSGSDRGKQKLKVAGVTLSNAQRILYPDKELTKVDIAGYYAELAEWIMPYVQHRPLALVRCPSGITEQCFFQKHPGNAVSKAVPRVTIDGKQGLYIDKLSDLIQIIQVGALELHTWGSKVENIECPDTLVFDLDPAPDVSLTETYSLALQLRDRLLSLGLQSFPRTTGGKGLHLVVPIEPKYSWATIKQFCRGVAVAFARDNPRKATAQLAKSKRKGRVFIDYLRNGRGATAISCFSTRARSGAPVAAPLRWDEVKPALRPDQYHVENIKRRLSSLKADPWADYAGLAQEIPVAAIKAMEKVK